MPVNQKDSKKTPLKAKEILHWFREKNRQENKRQQEPAMQRFRIGLPLV